MKTMLSIVFNYAWARLSGRNSLVREKESENINIHNKYDGRSLL